VGQMKAAGYPKFLVKLYEFLEKAWVRSFDRVVVCSHFLQKRYPEAIRIPNMIDLDLWQGKNKRAKQIVFVGQIGPYHGQKEVLQALTPVLKRNRNLKLVFIGGGEKLEDLRFKVEDLRLKKQVILTGQVSQEKVRKILAESLIGILPLWDIPVHQARHPLKMLEYLASGLVVITNDAGEATWQIKDKENGILCPPGDVKCLAQKTEMILANSRLARKISQKAIISVQEFSSEKILPKWIKLLEK